MARMKHAAAAEPEGNKCERNGETGRMFPMFVDISGKKVFVIGGGNVGTRRIETLLAFGPDITVISPGVSQELSKIIDEGGCRWIRKEYSQSLIEDADMVLACTDDAGMNIRIAADCRARGIMVNSASQRELCDFHFPGVVMKDEITIGINGSGTAHSKVKKVREQIEKILGTSVEEANK